MRRPQQHLFWNKSYYSISQFQMHTEVQYFIMWYEGFFLETPMSRVEYNRIHSKYPPADIRALYHIDGLIAKDGYVYINITKCMYGLKQAPIIAYKEIIDHMDPNGYYPVPFTTVPWSQQKRKRKCCLCVDDLSVKYFGKDYSDHLLDSLKNHYEISKDWEGYN